MIAYTKKGMFFLVGVIGALILDGCTVGPEYVPPSINMPSQWHQSPDQGIGRDDISDNLKRWWTVFQDPKLDFLIERALVANKDLRIAETRIREVRARYGIVDAERYPVLDASGDYRRSRTSEEISSPHGGEIQNLFQTGFDALWEIDFFGGNRRSLEAANADIAASQEAHRDVLVTLLAEVARSYIELRGSQQRIAIALENVKAQRNTVELIMGRVKAGIDNELRLAQSKAQLAVVEAQLPILERKANQAIHRLDVLIGQAPGNLTGMLGPATPIPNALPKIPVGIPSDLLRRRPDIRKAEREIAAATARIGIATADLFPKFSLTGSIGRQGLDFSDLAESGSTFWSIGPSIRWPVFDAGRIRANIQVQNARQETALIQYEKIVLASLEEVENALVAYVNEEKSRSYLVEAVISNRKAVAIAGELYQRGFTNFLDILIGQRALYASQDELVQSEQSIATNIVALFKALGGGWNIMEYS